MAKIFNTYDKDCITQIRLACDLPDISVLIEKNKIKVTLISVGLMKK